MPIKLDLIENGTVMRYTLSDPWSLAEMATIRPIATRHYDEARGRLDVLVDARAVHSVPQGIFRARTNPELTHPNTGRIAVIGAPIVLKIIIETVLRLAHSSKVAFFENEESAWTYLRSQKANSEGTVYLQL